MLVINRFLIGLAGAGLWLGAVSPAYAFMQSGSAQATTQLSTIVVQGQRLDFPLVLQIIKTSLHRPWSSTWANRNKLVCRFVDKTGTHFQRLSCMTNGEHFKRQNATQLGSIIASGAHGTAQNPVLLSLADGEIPIAISNWTNQHWVNRGAMMELLKKLPPAGSSYTLRITDHGKPVIDYVIEDGELKAVHRYTDKKQKN